MVGTCRLHGADVGGVLIFAIAAIATGSGAGQQRTAARGLVCARVAVRWPGLAPLSWVEAEQGAGAGADAVAFSGWPHAAWFVRGPAGAPAPVTVLLCLWTLACFFLFAKRSVASSSCLCFSPPQERDDLARPWWRCEVSPARRLFSGLLLPRRVCEVRLLGGGAAPSVGRAFLFPGNAMRRAARRDRACFSAGAGRGLRGAGFAREGHIAAARLCFSRRRGGPWVGMRRRGGMRNFRGHSFFVAPELPQDTATLPFCSKRWHGRSCRGRAVWMWASAKVMV